MHDLADRAAVDRYVTAHGPLEARTPHTLRSPEALHEALVEGRRNGYTLDLEENDLGIVCVALPVFLDSPIRPTGAISISSVLSRTSPHDLVAWLPWVREIVTEELGSTVLRPQSHPPETEGPPPRRI